MKSSITPWLSRKTLFVSRRLSFTVLVGLALATSAVHGDDDLARDSKAKKKESFLDAKLIKALPAPKPGKSQILFDGKTLKGWKTADKFDFERHGEVKVKEGLLTLGAGEPETGVSYHGEVLRDSYEVSLEAKRTDGGDFFCGMTFPVKESYCTLIIGGWGGGVIGLSNVDQNSAVENETTTYQEFENGRWYKIRLRVADDRIQAWIDKKQVVDLERGEHKFAIWWEQEPMRPLGIATYRTGSALRNIRLTNLAKPAAANNAKQEKTPDDSKSRDNK